VRDLGACMAGLQADHEASYPSHLGSPESATIPSPTYTADSFPGSLRRRSLPHSHPDCVAAGLLQCGVRRSTTRHDLDAAARLMFEMGPRSRVLLALIQLYWLQSGPVSV
jgi:hypothetical protein